MKKRLLVIGILAVLAVAAVAVVLATVDVDRYRPLVVSKLEAALGRPVRLDHISLGWHGGIALQLRGVAIAAEAHGAGEPAVEVEAVQVVIRLLPLLRKDVQVSSLVLTRPRLHVVRAADGAIAIEGLPSPGGRSGAVAVALPLLISSLVVEDGTLRVSDASPQIPLDLTVRKLDAAVRNISLNRPIEFRLRAACFSQEPNLTVSGRVLAPAAHQPGRLEGLRFETDLSQVDVAEATRSVPSLKNVGLAEGLRGTLTVSIDRWVFSREGLAELGAQVELKAGRWAVTGSTVPYDQVNLRGVAQHNRIELQELSAKVGTGTISATGVVDQLSTSPHTTAQVTMDALPLEDLLPLAEPNEPHLRGRLSFTFQGAAQGLSWEEVSRTLSGSGTLTLTDGVLVNLNVLEEVFRRLSILPGLVEALRARLPDSYQSKLSAQDTELQPITLPVTAEQGRLDLRDVRLASDAFVLSGSGTVRLDGALASQLMLQIDEPLSAAIIKSVKELQYLADAQGQLQIPVMMQGALPRIAVLPDVQYVAQRLVITKTQELIGGLLQKALDKSGTPQP